LSLRFSDDGPAFTNVLVDAMLNGEVVFLCGAGVSAPQLPTFGDLVTKVYARLGLEPTPAERGAANHERYEETLGALSRRLVNPVQMYQAVTDLLSLSVPDLAHHETLLRLSRTRDNRIILVTTNFDSLFERAADAVEGLGRGSEQSLAGQALPPPGGEACHGIIHLHGRIRDDATGLDATPIVLTSAEYGDAYMRSGWAARFLFDLVRCKTLVLIGYSANDAPVRYFLNLLEGDRVRFGDLRTVYALDSYESDPQETDERWATIAVTPLPYRKAPDGERNRHRALWRDLDLLADLVERPKAGRRARAVALLQEPFASTTDLQRDEIEWLLSGKGDLWGVAIATVSDPAWFNYFRLAKLWRHADAPRVIVNWCCRDLTDRIRLEAGIEWQKEFGRSFTDALNERLTLLLEKTPQPWALAWKALGRASHATGDVMMRHFRVARALGSPMRSDHDLRDAVHALTPRIQLSTRWWTDGDGDEKLGEALLLRDLVHVSLKLDDAGEMDDLNAAIRTVPGCSRRLAQLCTEALFNVGASASDVGLVTSDWDAMDQSVPSVETHDQNRYHDGIVHLCVLLTDLLPKLAAEDREYGRTLARSWSGIPGLVGQRLWVHALRNSTLFSSDEAAENILALSRNVFLSIRRELVLALKERLLDAAQRTTEQIVERILKESPSLYLDFDIEQGADWRPQARDHRVWLLLTAIRLAGVLPPVGQDELTAIAARNPFIAGDYEEQDLFGSYSTGVHSVQGDPEPLLNAMPEERLDVASALLKERDFNAQRSWAAYCNAEPEAAFEVLTGADLGQENLALWLDFLNVLTAATRTVDGARDGAGKLVPQVFARLRDADNEFLSGLLLPLSYLLPVYDKAGQNPVLTGKWWDRLWTLAEINEQDISQEDKGRFYDRVINRPSGRLVEWLLISIDGRKATTGVSGDDRARLRAVITSESTAGWLGRGACAHNAGFLLHVDPRLALRAFRQRLSHDDVEGTTLRVVLIGGAQLSFTGMRAYKVQLFKAVCETTLADGAASYVASKILSPLLSWRMTPGTARQPVSPEEVKSLLMRVPHAVLAGAAQCLRQWIGQIGGSPENAWATFIGPLFESIWPNEVRFKRTSVSRQLAALCVNAGPAFGEAFQAIRHYLSPFEADSISVSFMDTSDVTRTDPHTCLELLWLVCGPGAWGQSADLASVLDKIVAEAPALEVDRRLQWLEQHRAVRYE
jgi:hypothetical protein